MNPKKVRVGHEFKQGFKSSDGKYYGENIWDYLHLATTVPDPV
jgi:hypothetical protein